ncbi:MAG TPA: AraC family transcriptional regulator [Microbacterium sp.]|uniref:AraC family transcriptional regulator n=1 Tax=Microbacterium sp. TaxID=51671 RepID=UPI002B4A08ED|nr:AraC family transcriptional regulator [Microbacterium sp.]HKT57760.1 AraC family transcriptional regulator [Microbacterium sp.]
MTPTTDAPVAVRSTTVPAVPAVPAAPGEGGALESLLAAVEVRLRQQVRVAVAPGEVLELDRDALSLVYVIDGAADLRGRGAGQRLSAGDALLASGRAAASLRASGPVRMLVSTLTLAERAAHVAAVLPDTAIVRDFDRHEPAAASLAAQLGTDPASVGGQSSAQLGDTVICRMMAGTVLLSVIRAWAAHGCAPAGWPSRSNDPYLDRVVEAIHAAPGRDWSVAGLAGVGAMSRTVFAERFRAAFGASPASYVTEVRIRAAQDLLSRGCGVSEVSRALGYGSDEGFSRAFRRRTGQTPSAWRAAHAA